MSTVGELLVKIGVDTRPLTAGIATARAEMGSLKTAGAEGATGIGNVGKAAALAGAAVATGAALIGAESIHAASQFQEAQVKVQNNLNLTSQQADAMGTAIQNAALGTSSSATTMVNALAPVAGELARVQGGSLDAAATTQVLTAAQNLHEGANVTLDASLKDIADTLLVYHGTAAQAAGVSDTLFQAQAQLGVSVDDIAAAMQRLQPRLVGSGLNFQQVMGIVREMTPVVGTGGRALMQVGSVLQGLSAPSAAATKALAAAGVTLTDSHGKYIGAAAAIDAIKAAMDKIPATAKASAASQKLAADEASLAALKAETSQTKGMKAQEKALEGQIKALKASGAEMTQNSFLTSIFGTKAQIAAAVISGGSAALTSNAEALAKNGTAQTAAERNAATLADQEETLKATLSTTAVIIGSALLPALNSIFSAVLPIIKQVAEWMSNNRQLTAIILVVVGALGGLAAALAVLGPVFGVIGTVIGGIVTVAEGVGVALGLVEAAAVPAAAATVAAFLPIIAVVAAVGIAIALIVTHWNDVVAGAQVVAGAVGTLVGGIVSALQGLAGTIGDIFNGILSLIQGVIDTIGNVIGSAIDIWVTLYIRIPERIASFVAGVIGHFVDLAGKGLGVVTGFIGSVVGFFLGIPGKIIGMVTGVVGAFVNMEAQGISNILGFVGNVVRFLLGIPGQVIGGLSSGFANLAQAAVKAFMGVFGNIVGAVKGVIGSIPGIGAIVGAAGNVGSAIAGLVPHLGTGAVELPNDMLAFLHKGEMVVPAGPAAAMRSTRPSAPRSHGADSPMVGTLNIYNPAPEPASTSFRREVDKMQRLTAFGY